MVSIEGGPAASKTQTYHGAMAAPRNAIVKWSQYLAARTAVAALDCVNVDRKLELAGDLAPWLARIDRRHRERGLANLRVAFPEWSEARLARGVEDAFRYLLHFAVETLATPRMITHGSWCRRIHIGDIGPALSILNAGRPAILISGHVGAWEVLGYFLSLMGYRVHAVARPLDNPLINDWLLGVRERHGMRIITKWDAADQMMAILDAQGVLALIADQNAGDRGMFVPFFGRLASHYKSIGLLAMRKRVPIICGYAAKLPDRYEYRVECVDVIHPEDWDGRDDALFYITARYARAIEQMIRRNPDQYLWLHRRWKSRPRHEREGKPMPDSLRRSLEALPWMTPELMRQLELPPPPR